MLEEIRFKVTCFYSFQQWNFNDRDFSSCASLFITTFLIANILKFIKFLVKSLDLGLEILGENSAT